MIERVGEAFEFDEHLTVVGDRLKRGDPAPEFTLDWFNPGAGSPQPVSLSDTAGNIHLLNVVNSLDTPVCQIETRRWEQMLDELPDDTTIYTITMDLPFAINRWMQDAGITHRGLSSHRSEQFGIDYGVLIKEWRMLQRSVFVIDRSSTIAFVEYVNDQMKEPDYTAALEAVDEASK